MSKWNGVIISESLVEPSLLNEYDVYKIRISKREELIDEHGNKGGMLILGRVKNFSRSSERRSSSFKPKTSLPGTKLSSMES
jgi:hypothetical protein